MIWRNFGPEFNETEWHIFDGYVLTSRAFFLRELVSIVLPLMLILLGALLHGITAAGEKILDAELALAGISCPNCVYVPAGLKRIEDIQLVEGPIVSVPTSAYLAHLNAICQDKKRDFVQADCSTRLREINFGVDDVYSRVNPPYGRPEFTDGQLKDVRWGAKRIGELLATYEYWFIENQSEHYFQNKQSS